MGFTWTFLSIAAALAGQPGGEPDEVPRAPAFRLHFRLVQATAAPDFVEMSRTPRPPVFVGPVDVFDAAEILSVVDAGSTNIDLKVSRDLVARLRAQTVDRLAILDLERLAAVAEIEFPDADATWNLRLAGLERVEASRLGWMLSEEANSRLAASMVIVPPSVVQAAGSVVEAAVYLIGAKLVGSYQFVVEVSTPKFGWMRRDELLIDSSREDFVFQGRSPRTTIDVSAGTIGATIEPDGVSPDRTSVYLGSVRFRTSADAAGSFNVHIKRSAETFVKDKNGVPILFNHGGALIRFREPVVPRLEK